MLRDDDTQEPEPEPADVEGTEGDGTTGAAPTEPEEEPTTPRMDLGGPPRLDIPEPWWVDPSQAPSEVPGPDVEVPDWD